MCFCVLSGSERFGPRAEAFKSPIFGIEIRRYRMVRGPGACETMTRFPRELCVKCMGGRSVKGVSNSSAPCVILRRPGCRFMGRAFLRGCGGSVHEFGGVVTVCRGGVTTIRGCGRSTGYWSRIEVGEC